MAELIIRMLFVSFDPLSSTAGLSWSCGAPRGHGRIFTRSSKRAGPMQRHAPYPIAPTWSYQ